MKRSLSSTRKVQSSKRFTLDLTDNLHLLNSVRIVFLFLLLLLVHICRRMLATTLSISVLLAAVLARLSTSCSHVHCFILSSYNILLRPFLLFSSAFLPVISCRRLYLVWITQYVFQVCRFAGRRSWQLSVTLLLSPTLHRIYKRKPACFVGTQFYSVSF